ncbi:S-adenosyl-L-methionine dependent methyltransferase [Serendipita vermifera]|nr:S-adenosyl-L-methionine dependent methyltransferase [Serendipita vermifera]
MHIRNPYRTPPDFLELSNAYPLLKPYVYLNKAGTPSINFKDPAAQRHLTEALLHRDFNIKIEIPENRLCPAVPNRLNYVLWVQDIIAASPPSSSHTGGMVQGIDIGTGASVVYPLLGCALSPNWVFVGTDVDTESLIAADKNIAFNSLQNRITVVQSLPSGPLFSHLFEDGRIQSCDFLMCNPPFYASKEEITQAAEDKDFDPNAVCTGADVEMITPGGESVFVQKIVEESVKIQTRCRWYTSLLGKHSSVASIVALLKRLQIDNYGITEFVQGQTRRWGIVWSFGEERLPDALVRKTSESLHSLLPLPNSLRQNNVRSNEPDPSRVMSKLETLCQEVSGVCITRLSDAPSESSAKIWAKENTWSRKYRRMIEKRRGNSMDLVEVPIRSSEDEAKVVLLVRITIEQEHKDSPQPNHIINIVEAIWSRGSNRELFETLWSHLSRKLLDNVQR